MIFLLKTLIIFPFITQIIVHFFLKQKQLYLFMNIVYYISIFVITKTIFDSTLMGLLFLLIYSTYIGLKALKITKKKYKTLHINYYKPTYNKVAVDTSLFTWLVLVLIGSLKILFSIL